MRSLSLPSLPLLFLALFSQGAFAQDIDVVDMIPATLSGETWQDSEPSVTYNPTDPDEIVATAFTNNPSGATSTAPIYISQDGGNTWTLNNVVPSGNGRTGDITVALTRNEVLYAGILFGGNGLDMRILRSAAYTGGGTMTQLLGRTQEDQPYAGAYSPMGGANRNDDHLYVGHNDFNNAPQTASFEQSLDAETAPAPAGLATLRLERRTPSGQDGPPVRQAVHPDGTVYGIYTQRTGSSGNVRTGNIVVVRDDDWGQGSTVYADVTDPSDATAGNLVASGVSWIWNVAGVFGQHRLGDYVSIAVDPTDSRTVWVAWADRPATATGNTATLHVRRSTDGGQNWSGDLLTVNGAIAPKLAVNVRGQVAFLYHQLTGTAPNQRWETHVQQRDGGTWTDFTLADVPSGTPAPTFQPYLGDYLGLTAVGQDFYGVFSANNRPDNSRFPNGVTYQRNANFTTNTLTDGSGNPVGVSIDPFFFRVENLAEEDDFYVRDWTDSPTDRDTGLEPSTDPVFFKTSDIWNRRSNNSGSFTAADRPQSQDPQVASAGDNYAFARVHRKAAGAPETVTLKFLKSEFGVGSNYQAAGSGPDPTLNFSATHQVRTMSSGHSWQLNATSSSHVCLAVEISTPDDPAVAPGLLGRSPGWPDTDLMVIYDNNKAQRNLGVYTGSGDSGSLTYYAVAHNAATHVRDLVLQYDPDDAYERLFDRARVGVVGQAGAEIEEGRVVLADMRPGESRWVSLTVPVTPNQAEGESVSVHFSELVGNQPVNGFTIAKERAPLAVAAVDGLDLLAANLYRLGKLRGIGAAVELSNELREYTGEREEIDPDTYVQLVGESLDRYRQWLRAAIDEAGRDPFGISAKMERLTESLETSGATGIYPAQSNLDHGVDAFLTYLDHRRGNVADVAQNMRWQAELVRRVRALREIDGADRMAEVSERFDRGYAAGELSVSDYPAAVEASLPVLRRADEAMQMGQEETLRRMEERLDDPQRLQAAHRDFLLRLNQLRR